MYAKCFDIGGTQIRGALIGPNGIIKQVKEPTLAKGNVAALMNQLRELFGKLDADNIEIAAVSIGCAGPVSGTSMLGSKPLEIFETIDFAKELKDIVKKPIFVANDLNMAVRAELKWGKGRDCSNFCLVTLSTGIGVGVVVQSQVLNHRIEPGHSLVETDPAKANECHGHHGCWAAQASGSGIEATLLRQGKKQTATEFFKNPDERLLSEIRDYNARGLSQVIHAFDPQKIIFMGSVAQNQFDRVIPTSEEIAKYSILAPVPQLELSSLGDEIGLLGAYELLKEKLCQK